MSIVYFVPFRGSEDVNIFNVGHRNWIQQGSPLIHFPYLQNITLMSFSMHLLPQLGSYSPPPFQSLIQSFPNVFLRPFVPQPHPRFLLS